MLFIPNNQTLQALPPLLVETLDGSGFTVANSSIDLRQIVPNIYKDSISYSFTRSNNQSGVYTDLTISFLPRYPQKASLLRIDLPANENKIV
jgi:hypothetical protein